MWSRLLSRGIEQDPKNREQILKGKHVLLILGDGSRSKSNFVNSLFPPRHKESKDFGKLKEVYEGDTEEAKKAKLKDGYAKCPHCNTQMSSQQWIVDHIAEQHPNKKAKSDVEHGKYGGISTDTAYDIPKNTGYEERPHISLEEAGRLPRTTFNENGSEVTVPKGGKKEVGTFKAPPAVQKKLDMVKEFMGITDGGATNVVYGGSDNKYATALQNSTTKGRADNQVEDRE